MGGLLSSQHHSGATLSDRACNPDVDIMVFRRFWEEPRQRDSRAYVTSGHSIHAFREHVLPYDHCRHARRGDCWQHSDPPLQYDVDIQRCFTKPHGLARFLDIHV
jgi:hypothetical protein